MLSPGKPYVTEFDLQDPDTGGSAYADFLPVATAARGGIDDADFALTVANVALGRYKVSGVMPVGYTPGDEVDVSVVATVSGIQFVKIVDRFTVVSAPGTAGSGGSDGGDVPPTGTPCEQVAAAQAALVEALTSPASVSSDAGSVTQRSVDDLIRAANYLSSNCAGNTTRRGLRFNRLIPDGTVSSNRTARSFNKV